MANEDFKVIETQEDFDNAIKARLERERNKYAEQLATFDSTKDELTKAMNQIGELTEALKASNEKIASFDSQIAEKETKIKEYELRSVKTQIAHELGLSYDAIEFLKGDDEASIKQSAETLKNLVGIKATAPLASTERTPVDSEKAAYQELLNNLI